eukprot:gnl/TRDRNA2_/TRDRNA2_198755_c0_seq1.p1 gnl/TRDRNA2_/TRDRNA2_198755_c0~~gnl/TRDRNA2_/TRDRNA2_198755_c0_seq1.p1  ORF type:complete len:276 (+),score=19.81 gnl/TRDRNA2_/TRDRNA2_198755_c0_seq1:32-859(+)
MAKHETSCSMKHVHVQLENNCVDEVLWQRRHVCTLSCGVLSAVFAVMICEILSGSLSPPSVSYEPPMPQMQISGVENFASIMQGGRSHAMQPLGLQYAGWLRPDAQREGQYRTQPVNIDRRSMQQYGSSAVRQYGDRAARQRSTAVWYRSPQTVQAEAEDSGVVGVHSEDEFDAIRQGGGLVVLNVGTTWCVPCKQFMPKYRFYASQAEYRKVKFLTLTADENASTHNLMKTLGARSVPSFYFFRDGEKVGEVNGAQRALFLSTLDECLLPEEKP